MAELRKRNKKLSKPQDEPTVPDAGKQTFSGLVPLRRTTRLPPALKVPSRARAVLGADVQKRDAVVAAFRHAYSAYERDAFGADEYHPLGQKGSNLTAAGGIGYTIVDSLDTIILMQQQGYEFDGEYERARSWVQDTLSFDRDANFNTFEDGICVGKGVLDQDNNNFVSVAEVATLQLEFKYLSFLTDEDNYWRAAERVDSVGF
ncbi:mannosyl-oligosaccharide alpha-1,2-mannosidase [Ceratobasidium sp. 414]|nr:mannosyl-oligosaccharide alpha-1,2-mannosidase [Ceratobasidium sp. 414]